MKNETTLTEASAWVNVKQKATGSDCGTAPAFSRTDL